MEALKLEMGENLIEIPSLANTYGIINGNQLPKTEDEYLSAIYRIWWRVMKEADEEEITEAQMVADEAAEREGFDKIDLKKKWSILMDSHLIIHGLAGWSRNQWRIRLEEALEAKEVKIIPLPSPDDQPMEMYHLPSMMFLWSETIEG